MLWSHNSFGRCCTLSPQIFLRSVLLDEGCQLPHAKVEKQGTSGDASRKKRLNNLNKKLRTYKFGLQYLYTQYIFWFKGFLEQDVSCWALKTGNELRLFGLGLLWQDLQWQLDTDWARRPELKCLWVHLVCWFWKIALGCGEVLVVVAVPIDAMEIWCWCNWTWATGRNRGRR